MSRSAADATRFTANSPHAYAKPTPFNRASPSAYSASSTSRPNPNPRLNPTARASPPPMNPRKGAQGNTPPGETAAEKVARLRQARLKEKEAQITTWDRVVIRGRVWADRAHRVTVYSIVGFSIVAVFVTGVSLTDMIMHNRRKRTAFYNEQHALYAQRLIEAIETEKLGLPLEEDQTLILNRERARVQAEEAAKERTWRKRIKEVFVGGLKNEEEGSTAEKIVVPSEGEILQKMGVDQISILERAEKNSGVQPTDFPDSSNNSREDGRRDGTGILQAVAEKRREGERVMESAGLKGGPLDQMAEGAVQAVEGKLHAVEEKAGSRRGWSDWWEGK